MKQVSAIAIIAMIPFYMSAQTVLYNGGTNITADVGSIIYVDGDVNNSANGAIHNQGDIYLTGDWTNDAASGCLDPNTGTVILDGALQTIMGTQTTTFNNLDCQNGSIKTLNISTIVGGTSGVLSLNSSAFNLNSNTLIVTNPSSAAVTRTSGYIISETDPSPGYGIVQWNLGNSTGNYVYPFGTVGAGYIPFIYNITTAGAQSTSGNIAVATYPTSVTASPNNRPLPNGVTNLTDPSDGSEAGPVCNDRYWPVLANNYNTQPTADVTFTYEDAEWDVSGGSTNTIVEDSLRAWMWNGNQWQLPTLGNCNTSANTVFVSGWGAISAPWTLRGDEPIPPPPPPPCGDFFVPNAFSPNSDTKNDKFPWTTPRNCIADFSIKIYNRWGNLVFESTNPTIVWDGSTPKGKNGNEGVYAYEVKATFNGTAIDQKGTVTLMK